MKLPLTSILCTQCGLCCDGSLFSDVEVSTGEGLALEVLGLDIEDDDNRGLLGQRCGALKRKRCTIYSHRPACCRSFECRLLQQVKRGETSVAQAGETVENALSQIAAIKALIRELMRKEDDVRFPLKERFSDALALSDFTERPEGQKLQMQLEKAMITFENLVREMFLGH